MRRPTWLISCAAAVLAGALPRDVPVEAADAPVRFAVVVPAGDASAAVAAEFSYGVALAVDESEALRKSGGKRPAFEAVPTSAADAAAAVAAVEDAAKRKMAGVVALTAPAWSAAVEAAARKARLPLVAVGAPSPARTIDAADPVFRVEPEAGDSGLALAEALRFRSGRSSLGLPPQTTHAWLVVEDAPRARAIAAALRADDPTGIVTAGDTVVAADATASVAAADVAAARKAGCDRVVVVGGPATLRTVALALSSAKWDVAVLATGDALDGKPVPGAAERRKGTAFVVALPTCADDGRVSGLTARRDPPAGKGVPFTPAAARALAAAGALLDAAAHASKKGGVVAALREADTALGTRPVPLFDGAGTLERWAWSTWAAGADGVAAPVKAAFLPDAALGPYLGGKPTARYRAAAGGTVVRVGFGGDEGGPPRTIDADLATLGLFSGGSAPQVDELVREAIVARTCGKLSRIWGRCHDATPKDALSFRITFVAEGAPTDGATAVWTASIAGDGPEGLHGGQSFPATKRAQALSTYLLRNAALLRQAKLDAPVSASDLPYLDGTYAWNTSAEGNQRCDRLRALVDGVASTYSMKLSKEVGHLAGLDVDHSGDPRSVMVAKGGEGVPDEAAYFPPAYAKVLEKTLGRVPAAVGVSAK